MRKLSPPQLRLIAALVATLSLAGCTGGINAGKDGGIAFVAFTGMLIIMVAILWFALGRED